VLYYCLGRFFFSSSTVTSFNTHHRHRSIVSARFLPFFFSSPSKPLLVAHRTRFSTTTLASFAQLQEDNSNDDNDEDDELLKWERMYYAQGESSTRQQLRQRRQLLDDEDGSTEMMQRPTTDYYYGKKEEEVRVVSFDLDNTVWKTSVTIDAANDFLARFLEQELLGTDSSNGSGNGNAQRHRPQRVEVVMGQLFREDREQNTGRYGPVGCKAPVLLTMLRKDAIRKVLAEHYNGSYGLDDPEKNTMDDMVERAFDEWTRARHDAIVSNMAQNVEQCLERIATIRSSVGHPVVIGAITDGNSDPALIESLRPYFQFVVNAESVGVGKPDKRVYLRAVSDVMTEHRHALRDIIVRRSKATGKDAGDHDDLEVMPLSSIEDILGPWWVHVGDDFVKDVVAAKDLNMRTVWCRELVMDKLKLGGGPAVVDDKQQPNGGKSNVRSDAAAEDNVKQEKSVQDLVKQVSEMKVVKMQVGATDYLTDSVQNEFADAVVDSFEDLSRLLNDWHETALLETTTASDENIPEMFEGESGARATITTATTRSSRGDNNANNSNEAEDAPSSQPRTVPSTTTKFCFFCGTKLPAVAKFCSSCGESQSQDA